MDLDLHSLSSDSDGDNDGGDGADAGSNAAGQSIQTGATAGNIIIDTNTGSIVELP